MGRLQDQMKTDLLLKRYSPHTTRAYLRCVRDFAKHFMRSPAEMSVAITVSDITRPVPYRGESGILPPLLRRLESSGIKKENIKIIVGTGMHRASTYGEKVEMYGQEVVDQYKILDHDCENNNLLESIGTTRRGTHVYINRDFYFADLKIATGLVESHFFTGISGGRKAGNPSVTGYGFRERDKGSYLNLGIVGEVMEKAFED